MKFCFFGYDHTLDGLVRLVEGGHELLHVFTFNVDGFYARNNELKQYCESVNVSVQVDKVTPENIAHYIDQGCEIFISNGYPHKIPPFDEKQAYGINLHPTYLPRARGVMPQPYVIMEDPSAAGFSIHKLTQEYDAGDILFQKQVTIDETTDIETLSAMLSVHCPDALLDVVNNIETYWNNATPQDESQMSYYDEPPKEMRTLNWDDDFDTMMVKRRAFGRYGLYAFITNKFGETQTLAVFQFNGWKEDHKFTPGTLIKSQPREIIIAVKGGFLCLMDFMPIDNAENV